MPRRERSAEERAAISERFKQIHEDPRAYFERLERLERRDPEIRAEAAHFRGEVSMAMQAARGITKGIKGLHREDPEVLIDTDTPGAHPHGHVILFNRDLRSEWPDSYPSLGGVRAWQVTAFHEVVHYWRAPFDKDSPSSRLDFPDNYPWKAMDEGIADSAAAHMRSGRNAAQVFEYLKTRYEIGAIEELYGAMARTAATHTGDISSLNDYLIEHHYHPEKGGVIYKGSSDDVYNVAAMMAIVHLAAHNSDARSATLEILTSPIDALLQRTLSAIADDPIRVFRSVSRMAASA